ncbi:MAG: HAD-IIIC family phosphatase [Syntrophobacteraceae bacterium]
MSKDVIEYIFSQYDDSGVVSALDSLFASDGYYTTNIAETIDNSLEARMESGSILIRDWLLSLANSERMLPRFLYARFLERQDRCAEAVEILQSLADSAPRAESLILLDTVRLLVRMKSFHRAAETLRLALSSDPPYSFHIKCERLLQKIIRSNEWQPRATIRIALLGSSTLSFLAPVIRAACFKAGILAEMHTGEYGNFRQNILNPDSSLYAFKPQAVILLLNHRDLALPPISEPGAAEQIAGGLRNLWAILQSQNPCHLIQVGFDSPSYGSWGSLEDILPGGRARIINHTNLLLSENLPSGVSFCDINRVALQLGSKFNSDVDWYSSKQYPALEALPALSNSIAAHLRAAFGYAAKVLVVDLDNTLWGGVIGEDGPSGIILGPPSPEGECYLDLQRYIKELKQRGILLAVCSKNNFEDAEAPFKEHESMVLRFDDFVIFTANWQDKASNIKEMAQKLSLGLDSFVYLDDNPLERAWVRSRLPEVIVPECGNTPWEMLAALRQGMFFETTGLSEEDIGRSQSYKSNFARQELEKNAATLEEFLAGLEMVAETGPVDNMTLARVTQLINKTNQFNLTTRRYSEQEVRRMAASPDWWTRWFRLKDKFGDHGLIGVILAGKSANQWNVDTWLMSCRVLGRKMEEFMHAELVKAAFDDGAAMVTGEYIPTRKNELVKDMYPGLGFVQGNGPNHFAFHIMDLEIPGCEFIRKAEPPGVAGAS